MKILYFIDSLAAGGKERRLIELMKGIKSKPNIEFELVIMSKNIHYQQVFEFEIKIHYLTRNTKYDLSVFYKFYTICKNSKPDIVHCWDGMTAVFAIPACKSLKIKLANGMVTNTPVKQNIFSKVWLYAKLTFPFSSIIIGNSIAGIAAYNAPRKKSFCIYNGIDLTRFDNLKESTSIHEEIFGHESNNIFIAGMVAAFEERKDYKSLIKSAITLIYNNDNIRFVLIGDGADLQEIKRGVSASLLSKIIFLGKRSDIESIVNIFDVGILLTNTKKHGEGISNSIMEYMALGKPVIATAGGGTNEIVKNNITGYLVSPSNAEELAEKLEILLHDVDLCTKMGLAGKERIQEYFSIERMVNEYISICEKLCNN